MEIKTQSSKRIFYYDSLRALAIIGVIACHVSAPFVVNMNIINTPGWILSVFFNSFREFSIPIFVMISGALLVNKDYQIRTFIKKKFNRILIPYIFWVIMFILFAIITFTLGLTISNVNHMSLSFIYKIIFGYPGYARVFWFVWMILVVYIVLFILNKLIKKVNIENFNSKVYKSILILLLIYSIIVSLKLFSPMQHTFIYYLSFTGYAVLGYYLAKTDFTTTKFGKRFCINEKKILIASFILSILFYIIVLLDIIILTNNAGKYTSLSHFNIIKLILVTNIFLFFRYFEEYDGKTIKSTYNKIKEGIIGKLINSLSKYSFGIYLSHILVLKFYLIYVFNNINLGNHNPIKWVPFLLIITLVTSWILVWAMSKVPYLEKVSGT
ncbi:MAG: acyltransferase family protein [Methanobacteriaceae archaeon]|nr:acyltransferase family protein [Methanobacteriaceae archaeon]